MRALLAAVVLGVFCALAATDPSVAATLSDRPVDGTAGPALGPANSVVWGRRRADDAIEVVRRPMGGPLEVLHRIEDPPGLAFTVGFGGIPGGLGVSAERIAFPVTRVETHCDGDSCGGVADTRTFGGPLIGPYAQLTRCDRGAYVTVAVDGPRVAVGESGSECSGKSAKRIWLLEPGSLPRLVHEETGPRVVIRVDLEGDRLAWLEGYGGGRYDTLRVVDAGTFADLARFTGGDFFERGDLASFDLADDGTVVATGGAQPRCMYVCIAWRRLGESGRHLFARRAYERLMATEAGRIAYVRPTGRFTAELLVRAFDGTMVARPGRFDRLRVPTGELDLDRHRIAWSWRRDERSPRGAVKVAGLP